MDGVVRSDSGDSKVSQWLISTPDRNTKVRGEQGICVDAVHAIHAHKSEQIHPSINRERLGGHAEG